MKLIAYLSNGYPNLKESNNRAIEFVKAGVDIIEADFPSKDPYLDSEYLQNRIFAALKEESNYDKYMQSLLNLSNSLKNVEFLINIYPETIREIGLDKFLEFMNKLNQNEVLLVGNKDLEVRKKLEKAGLSVSVFVTRKMNEEDLKIAKEGNGFVYMEAFAYDGSTNKDYPDLKDCVAKVRSLIGDRKIYCGVGIHTKELFKQVKDSGADGAFLGSILLKMEDDGEDVLGYIKELKSIAI